MHDVIDCINVTTSPEEVAIHFLIRHATCRMALTGWTEKSLPHCALDGSQLDAPAVEQEATGSSCSGENAAAGAMPAPPLVMEDSCAARFSQAYAAARHMSAARHTMTTMANAVA